MHLNVITTFFFLCMVTSICCGKYYRIDGKIYYSSYPDMRNWHLAKQFCTYMGSYLVNIHSDAEHQRIVKVINNTEVENKLEPLQYWTSGTDLGSNGRFYWDTTGNPFTYTNWNVRQPDIEHCVAILSFQYRRWDGGKCTLSLPFICRDTFDVPE